MLAAVFYFFGGVGDFGDRGVHVEAAAVFGDFFIGRIGVDAEIAGRNERVDVEGEAGDRDFFDNKVVGVFPSALRDELSYLREVGGEVVVLILPELAPEPVVVEGDHLSEGVAEDHRSQASVADGIALGPVFRGSVRPDYVARFHVLRLHDCVLYTI